MAKSAQDIVALFTAFDASPTGSMSAVLKDALATLEPLWSANQQAEVEKVAQKIADSARTAQWRIPIGQSGVLAFFLERVQDQGTDDPVVQTLRVIGNSCVECNENRHRVVASGKLPYLVGLLKEDKIVKFVLPMLFNICVDCVPAQNQVYEAGFSKNIIDIIGSARLEPVRGLLGLMFKALELLEASKNSIEPKFAESQAATRLIKFLLAKKETLDLEEFTDACTVTLAYLSHARFQDELLKSDNLDLLLDLFSYSLFLEPKPEEQQDDDPDLDEDDIEIRDQRIANRAAFVDIIAKISEHDDYFLLCGPGTTSYNLLVDKFLTSSHPQLQIVACLCLGNMACSDDSSIAVGSDARVREALISIVAKGVSLLGVSSTAVQPSLPGIPKQTSEPLQVVHQAISCLKNLAIPKVNKPLLGELLEDDVLPKYWSAPSALDQGVLPVVMSLTRLLVTNCPENASRMIKVNGSGGKTGLQMVIDVLDAVHGKGAPSPEVTRIKTDVYRAVCAICRVLICSDVPALPSGDPVSGSGSKAGGHEEQKEDGEGVDTEKKITETKEEYVLTLKERADLLRDHPDIADVLGKMLEDCKHLGIRAEVLFVLAKMAGMWQWNRDAWPQYSADLLFIAASAFLAIDGSPKTFAALADCVLGEGEGVKLLVEAGLSGSESVSDVAASQPSSASEDTVSSPTPGIFTTTTPSGTEVSAQEVDNFLAERMTSQLGMEPNPGDNEGMLAIQRGLGVPVTGGENNNDGNKLVMSEKDTRTLIVRQNGLILALHLLAGFKTELLDRDPPTPTGNGKGKTYVLEEIVRRGRDKVGES